MADLDPNDLADSMEPPGDDAGGGGDDDLTAAMTDLGQAFDKKDYAAAATAFKAAMALVDKS